MHFSPSTSRKKEKREMKTHYQVMKEKTRDEAISWQMAFSEESLSYGELCEIREKLEEKAQRYGLLREFAENGVL